MLQVYTAQLSRYRGPDRLDITVKSGATSRLGGVVGSTFAPTWDIVMGHKRGHITDAQYTAAYYDLMKRSYVQNRVQWHELLAMERVVLCCYCSPGRFCHRRLLAEMLVKCGAAYCGEVK